MSVTAMQTDMFPALARNTVSTSVRDQYNRFRADQQRLGGLMDSGMARFFLGVSRQRLHELLKEGKLRYVTYDGYRYVSGDDIKDRLTALRDKAPDVRGGRPYKTKA